MRLMLRNFMLLVCITFNTTLFAQSEVFSSSNSAILALFPNKNPHEWTSTEGDLNGDGVTDVAVIVTLMPEIYPFEVRLLVLAGIPSGGYRLLSVSDKYCDAQKFFNLEIVGSSLFVTAIHKVESDDLVTDKLQYRFNKKYLDLELIGRENISETIEEKSYYRLSVNYLNGLSIVYEQNKGRAKPKVKKRFNISSLPKLNGFDCEKFFDDFTY